MTHLLVTGGSGQVGSELARLEWPAGVDVHFPGRAELDLASEDSIRTCLASRPWSAVINCAAYTAVDRAESEPATAFLINAQGPAWLAEATGHAGIPLIHLSTDYVFDGEKPGPYGEEDTVGPIGAYGASKLAGELAIRAGNPRHAIVRTSWILSVHGSNFLKTMLRLGRTNRSVRVVGDQHGNPTVASDLAMAIQAIAMRLAANPDAGAGIWNAVNSGDTTWYELARAIFGAAREFGLPDVEVEQITTAEYPTPARRPANSRLSTARLEKDFGIAMPDWHDAVRRMVGELLTTQS